MITWPRWIFAFSLVMAAATFAEDAEEPVFVGVWHIAHEQKEPYPLAWHLVRIDTQAPGIRFITTAPNGDEPGDTDTETTRDFAQRSGVQVAINGNFFGAIDEPTTDVLSLAVSAGECYSPWSASLPWGINIDPENHASIIRYDENETSGYACIPQVTLYNALAGNVRVVAHGKSVAPESKVRHPRTAVGVTKHGELLLLVVDGRHGAHSLGVTYAELAQILVVHGAQEAINLDGGGSSTLVIANPVPRVVNVPMPFEAPVCAPLPPFPLLRAVGNNLGIYATTQPLSKEGSEEER